MAEETTPPVGQAATKTESAQPPERLLASLLYYQPATAGTALSGPEQIKGTASLKIVVTLGTGETITAAKMNGQDGTITAGPPASVVWGETPYGCQIPIQITTRTSSGSSVTSGARFDNPQPNTTCDE